MYISNTRNKHELVYLTPALKGGISVKVRIPKNHTRTIRLVHKSRTLNIDRGVKQRTTHSNNGKLSSAISSWGSTLSVSWQVTAVYGASHLAILGDTFSRPLNKVWPVVGLRCQHRQCRGRTHLAPRSSSRNECVLFGR